MEKFETWCIETWKELLEPTLRSKNMFYYHRCCLTVSTRMNSAAKTHKTDLTFSSAWLRIKCSVKDAASFHKMMVDEVDVKLRRGSKVRFPSVNMNHSREQSYLDRISELEAEVCLLKKRKTVVEESLYAPRSEFEKMKSELERTKVTIKELQKRNEYLTTCVRTCPVCNVPYANVKERIAAKKALTIKQKQAN